MRKTLMLMMVLCLALSLGMVGCGAQKAESSSKAIDTAKTMDSAEKQANYLVGQAKAFYNSKEYQEAANVAQYVLSSVDKNSAEAKAILEKAKADLAAQAKKAAADVKKSFGGFGKK